MATTFDLDEYASEAQRAGASGFILLDISPSDLVHGLQTVLSGDALLAPIIVHRLVDEFLTHPQPSTHVARVLAKLGVRDRVHAVVAAYGTGLAKPGN